MCFVFLVFGEHTLITRIQLGSFCDTEQPPVNSGSEYLLALDKVKGFPHDKSINNKDCGGRVWKDLSMGETTMLEINAQRIFNKVI